MRDHLRRRGIRAPSGTIELQDRDIAALTFVALASYCFLTQVERDCGFPVGSDRGRRRARRWFDAGLVNVSIASSTKPAILSMTKKGLAVLGQYRPDVVERARLPGAIKLGAVDHHCARVDVRSFMEAWARDVRGARLADWSGPRGTLAKTIGLQAVEPDLVAQFEVGDRRPCIAVEVDAHGTEPLATLRKKMIRYVEVAPQLDGLWFVVLGGEARQRNIQALLDETRLCDVGRVLNHDFIVRRPVSELPPRGKPEKGHHGPNMGEATSA